MDMKTTLANLNQQGFAFCPPLYSEAEVSNIVMTIEINTKEKANFIASKLNILYYYSTIN